MPYYDKSFIDQARSVKMAGYWLTFLFCFFMDLDVSVHKNAKRELSQYPAIKKKRKEKKNTIIELRIYETKLLMEPTENSEKPEPQMVFEPTTLRSVRMF